jgi:glycosyltransferase involved in cell wall biosynthesis
MKIAFLLRSLGCGGAQRQLALLARELHARGHAVTVVVFYAGGHFEAELCAAGVPVRVLDKRGRWDLVGFLPRLARTLREVGPDILHGYLGTPDIAAALVKSALPGTRVVFGVRGSKSDLARYGWAAPVTRFAEARLSRAADLMIANSEAGLRGALAAGFRARRMTAIPNGIDTEAFRPDRAAGRRLRECWGVKDDEPLVGLAARVDPCKDHAGFLRAAALALEEHPKLRFVCAGDGTREFGRRAASLGLAPQALERTVFAGRVDGMAAFYNALDVATLTSAFGEGFPNVVGEAMACGAPTVVTDVGDAARVVGGAGVVVPPRDPQALAAGWLKCLGRDRAALGAEARGRVVEHFGVRRLVERTEGELMKL